ncbi:MAG: RNA polymerase subunit sigma-70 [Spirochaetaceae bacterium]|nr:RNA polymerase subunit sigma-70 [Spirochaetaceae bacterium]
MGVKVLGLCLVGCILLPIDGRMDSTDALTLEVDRKKLLGFVRSRVNDPDTAEDILQEALLRFIGSEPQLPEEALLPWFYRVLRNLIIDHYRRSSASARKLDSIIQDFDRYTESPEGEQEACQCFRDLLPSLKPEYRQVIEWMELDSQSPDEVAARLGIEKNNLKVRRHRARQQLKDHLEKTCRLCAKHGCLDCTCGG